jgi:hypothetical protein
MSVQEWHWLVVSLADSLEDLKIQIGDYDGAWTTVERLKDILEKDNETKDAIQLAQSLLRLLDVDVDVDINVSSESNGVESSPLDDSWSQLLSTFPPDTPLRSLLIQENSEKKSDKNAVTDNKSKIEYLHVLATTLQQRRLKQLKKGKEETQRTTDDDENNNNNPDYPLNFLSPQASAEQKSLLLEGYAYLKEDYEQRRQGMRQRFKVLLETTEDNSGRKQDIDSTGTGTVSPQHPPTARQLNPKEDLSWLVQHFIGPHHHTATRNPPSDAPKQQSRNHLFSTETAVDRGGRVDDDDDESRYAMPEWQSAGRQESNFSQPQNQSSNPKKNTGRKEKQGTGTQGRQSNSNSNSNGGQQSNEQKHETKVPEGDNEKAGDKDLHKKNNRRGGGNRRRGRGGGRGRGRGRQSEEGPGA